MTRAEIEALLRMLDGMGDGDHVLPAKTLRYALLAALDYLDKLEEAEREAEARRNEAWMLAQRVARVQERLDMEVEASRTAYTLYLKSQDELTAAKKVANAERERCAEIAYNNYSWDEIADGIRALPPPFPEEGEKG